MKKLLKKTFSLLIALTILLCGISAIADDGDEPGYSMISEIIPEETEEPAPVPEPAAESAKEATEEIEEKSNPEGETGPETQEPEATETETAEEPAAEAAEAPEDETMIETTVPEEEPKPELQESAVTDEEGKEEPMERLAEESVEEPTKEVAEPAKEIKSETESGEYEQLAEPESIPEAEENGNQQTEELSEGQEAEQQTESEEPEVEQPITEEQKTEQPKTENSEAATDSVEIIIAKSLTPNESWKGTVRNTKPTILKLDVADSRMIHLFVEGKDVLYSVRKADGMTEDAGYVLTDTATNHSVTSWAAEAGSYLISIRAGENSMGARVTISFKNDEEFAIWEDEQAAPETETDTQGDETPEEPEESIDPLPEDEAETERIIDYELTWDTDDPVIGDTAHFNAKLIGYEGLTYTLQWQMSPDKVQWTDIEGETHNTMDIVITPERNATYWRLTVYLEQPQE